MTHPLLKIFVILFLTNSLGLSFVHAEEKPAGTQVTTMTPQPPKYFLTYSYYKYDLQGTNAATTGIYRFDASTVDLNMITATWLYSPQWTLLTFVPHVKNMVETVYFPGSANVKTRDFTEGLGDIRLMAMTPVYFKDTHLVLADISLTLPTGSVDQYFTSSPTQRAAYNMQLGSGTPDLIAGASYTQTLTKVINSARAQATVRGGRNSNGWALGNELIANASSKYLVTKHFEVGLAANYKIRDQVQGRDDKYEKFNNLPGYGDGHQYYHAPQSNWDTQVVAKLSSPALKNLTASLEGGVTFYRDARNKDDVRLDMPYWMAASVTGTF